MTSAQRPIELILARNLVSNLSTPAFIVDRGGILAFYNEAAGALLGIRFEEAGRMGPEEWGTRFGPFDENGIQIAREDLPLTIALREGKPQHSQFRIRSADGTEHDIEVTAFPILAGGVQSGALAIFWPLDDS